MITDFGQQATSFLFNQAECNICTTLKLLVKVAYSQNIFHINTNSRTRFPMFIFFRCSISPLLVNTMWHKPNRAIFYLVWWKCLKRNWIYDAIFLGTHVSLAPTPVSPSVKSYIRKIRECVDIVAGNQDILMNSKGQSRTPGEKEDLANSFVMLLSNSLFLG